LREELKQKDETILKLKDSSQNLSLAKKKIDEDYEQVKLENEALRNIVENQRDKIKKKKKTVVKPKLTVTKPEEIHSEL
jgi:hypothetical protein